MKDREGEVVGEGVGGRYDPPQSSIGTTKHVTFTVSRSTDSFSGNNVRSDPCVSIVAKLRQALACEKKTSV